MFGEGLPAKAMFGEESNCFVEDHSLAFSRAQIASTRLRSGFCRLLGQISPHRVDSRSAVIPQPSFVTKWSFSVDG